MGSTNKYVNVKLKVLDTAINSIKEVLKRNCNENIQDDISKTKLFKLFINCLSNVLADKDITFLSESLNELCNVNNLDKLKDNFLKNTINVRVKLNKDEYKRFTNILNKIKDNLNDKCKSKIPNYLIFNGIVSYLSLPTYESIEYEDKIENNNKKLKKETIDLLNVLLDELNTLKTDVENIKHEISYLKNKINDLEKRILTVD